MINNLLKTSADVVTETQPYVDILVLNNNKKSIKDTTFIKG